MDFQNEPPVYKASYILTLEVLRFVKDCHKDFKFTLGTALQTAVLDMNLLIYLINESRDKYQALNKAINKVYFSRLILRAFIDLGIMKMETSISLNIRIESLLQQLINWRNSYRSEKAKLEASA